MTEKMSNLRILCKKIMKKCMYVCMYVRSLLDSEYQYWIEISRYYKLRTGKELNYKQPMDINEKLLWLAYYWQHPLIVQCADKVKVRDYVEQCGLNDLLIPIFGIWHHADEINFDELPNSFVLKCNHGCGMNILVKDKKQISINDVQQQLNAWLLMSYGNEDYEHQYQHIKPLIYCEKLLPFEGKSIVDYKLHCINGEPFCFLICTERDKKGHAKLFSYDLEWNRTALLNGEEDTLTYKIDKPKNMSKILESARILAKPFPYVRVDFYEVDGILYIGEMTFTPHGNIMEYYKDEVLLQMGEKLILPSTKYRGYRE